MTDTVGDNARPTLDFLARTILECTRDIQPVTIRLEAAKAAFREHAPAYCAIPGLGTVQVATPPQPGAPRVVYALADNVATETSEPARGEHRFCGAKTNGGVYCAGHKQIAYTGAPRTSAGKLDDSPRPERDVLSLLPEAM